MLLDSSPQNLSTDIYLFRGGLYFPIVFGNDFIMMLLLVTWFSNLQFLELRIDYQPAKFQFCRLYVASFTDGLGKTQ